MDKNKEQEIVIIDIATEEGFLKIREFFSWSEDGETYRLKDIGIDELLEIKFDLMSHNVEIDIDEWDSEENFYLVWETLIKQELKFKSK